MLETLRQATSDASRRHRVSGALDLALILAFAFLLRLAAILAFPSLHHPDENFQLFEQAHRLAFGYGVKPWEFEDGIRSLVLPYLLAKVFAFADPVFGGPRGYLICARVLLALWSLVYVAAIYRMGLRSSRIHALLGGLVAASWFELVYFAGRPLTEALACDFLLVALAVASRPRHELMHRHLLTIGLCFAMTLMLRAHLFAGILFAALWIAGGSFRERWAPLILGGLVPVILFGAADWLAWGSPFHSYVAAFRVNLLQGKSAAFGTHAAYWYVERVYALWFAALPILLLLIGLRARASALWIGVAVAILASHSAIPHKEYRFVFPALACLIVTAAMGSADLVEWVRRVRPRLAPYLAAGCAACWLLASATLASGPGFSQNWTRSRDFIEMSFWLSGQTQLCGLALYDDSWIPTGGYAHLHRDVPIYALSRDRALARRSTEAFDFVLLRRASIADFAPSYELASCVGNGASGDLCILRRQGSCRRLPRLVPLTEQSRLGADPRD